MTQVTNTVRFVLDGQIVEAQGVRRTTTVLDTCVSNYTVQAPKRAAPKAIAVRVW
jgi:hypothetical protein